MYNTNMTINRVVPTPKNPFDVAQMSTIIVSSSFKPDYGYNFLPLESYICLISYRGKIASLFLPPQALTLSLKTPVSI